MRQPSKTQQAVLDTLKSTGQTVVYFRPTDSAWYYAGPVPKENRKRIRPATFHALVLDGHLKMFDKLGGDEYYEVAK